jgi:hypothetical protein
MLYLQFLDYISIINNGKLDVQSNLFSIVNGGAHPSDPRPELAPDILRKSTMENRL